MPLIYRVSLALKMRSQLKKLVNEGVSAANKLTHARILLLADTSRHGKSWNDRQIAEALDIGKNTVRRTRKRYVQLGQERALTRDPSVRSLNRKFNNPTYKRAIFKTLHAPPASFGFNRTTWRQADLLSALKAQGVQISKNYISRIICDAGYRRRKARTVLTSNDPHYQVKVDRILSILHNLKKTERFFSIDEFGPVAVKQHGGRRLVAPGEHPTVPQIQVSKGVLLLTAALELTTNQITHFYSNGKNSEEMIRLVDLLIQRYGACTKLFLSWDAASWHGSKRFLSKLKEVNSRSYRSVNGTPMVELVPLPSRAQFLNVIESVFAGLATSIIHNSDYPSMDEAKKAIDRYFADRNTFFKKHPKRAGNRIWLKEKVPSAFDEGQNCKHHRFR